MAMFGIVEAITTHTSAYHFTWDIIIVIIFIAGSLIYGFLVGRKQIMTMLVSVYLALAVTLFFPFYENLAAISSISVSVIKISVFIGVTLIASLLIVRSKIRYLLDKHEKMNLGSTLVMSLVQVGLCISLVLLFLPLEFTQGLRIWTQFLFTTPSARFVWIMLPILSMMILKK